MAAGRMKVDIVTPDRLLLSISDAVSLIVPAEEGYLGVLPGHAPLLARLVPGTITLKHANSTEEEFATSGGYVEVSEDRVTLLADSAERPDEIDVERAKTAYQRALQRLGHPGEGVDVDRARLALERAVARLRIAGRPIG